MSLAARAAARLMAVVVFPTPPFWLAIAKTLLKRSDYHAVSRETKSLFHVKQLFFLFHVKDFHSVSRETDRFALFHVKQKTGGRPVLLTRQAQITVQNGDCGRRHPRNSPRLTQRGGPHPLQFVLHLAGKSRNALEPEADRNGTPLGALHALHLPLLLLDIAAVLDLGLDGRQQPPHRGFAKNFLNPRGNLRNRRLRALQPLPVAMGHQRRAQPLALPPLPGEHLPPGIAHQTRF